MEKLENFLNETTFSKLQQEKSGDEKYYKGILSCLRKLLVNCEDGLEVCQIILKNEMFNKAAAEKTLYKIYHQCIEEYFSPKSDHGMRIVVLHTQERIPSSFIQKCQIAFMMF